MFFTPAERRLLAFLALLLSGGFVLTGLRQVGILHSPPSTRTLHRASTLESPDRHPRIRAVASSPFTDGHLDLNLADSLDLMALPGVGPVLAGRILALRRQRSGFRTVDELLDVKGIGRKRLASLSQYLKVK